MARNFSAYTPSDPALDAIEARIAEQKRTRVWFLGICEGCRYYAECTAATSVGPILCGDCFEQSEED